MTHMKKELLITLTSDERKELDGTCKKTKTLLLDMASRIDDVTEREVFWENIRAFNKVADVFTE